MSEKKYAAIYLADGCEEIEALTVADLLRRAGIEVTLVSITEEALVTSSHNVRILADTVIGAFDPSGYDVLILPGGVPGTPNLQACSAVTDAVSAHHAAGRTVAAICAAPSILAGLGMLRGVPAVCNPSFEHVLLENGADLHREPVCTAQVPGRGTIITSRAMGTAIPFGLAILSHLRGPEAAEALGKNILYLS